MPPMRLLRPALGIAAILLAPRLGQSQSGPKESLRAGPAYVAAGPRVSVVIDPHLAGEGSVRLEAADFALLDGGKEIGSGKAVREFSELKDGDNCVGMAVVSLLDVSGSMKGRPLEVIRQGLADSAGRLRECDRAAIGTVADETRWEVDWTTARDRVQSAIETLAARGKLTRLYDGVDAGIEKFLSGKDLPARRRLFVISDGHDEGSSHSIESVIERANQLRISIDTVGVASGEPAFLRGLLEMSEGTGGLYREAQDTEKLRSLVAEGINRLLKTRVVEFESESLMEDGRKHTYVVRWKARKLEDSVEVTFSEGRFAMQPWHWVLAGVVIIAASLFVRDLSATRKTARRPIRGPETTRNRKGVQRTPTDIKLDPAGGGSQGSGPRTAFEGLGGKTPAASTQAEKTPVPPPPAPQRPQPERAASTPAAPSPELRKTRLGIAFPPDADGIAAKLVILEGVLAGRCFGVPATAQFWIGASAGNALVLPDPAVSGNHAVFRYEDGYLWIQDAGSRNGTWVNQQNIGTVPHLLSPRDRIVLGRSVMVVEAAS